MKIQPSFWSPLIDAVLPRVCALCRRGIAEPNRDHLCGVCEAGLEWIGLTTCLRCGAGTAGTPGFRPGQCAECRGRRFGFDRAVAVGRYLGQFRELLQHFKYHEQPHLAYTMAEWIGDRLQMEPFADEVEAVTTVPSHPLARVDRPYYAAEVLAERVAHRLGRPYAHGLLVKVRHTEPQTGLPRHRRLRNPAGAFAAGGSPPNVVLLVDDVLTTGATATECARALKRAGAREVYLAVVAR